MAAKAGLTGDCIVTRLRTAVLAIVLVAASVPAAVAVQGTFAAGADHFARAVVDQSFDALLRIPVAPTDLRAALSPRRSDRQDAPAANPARRTVTVGGTVDEGVTVLVRLPAQFAAR
jgi:hypothetical protein